MKIASLEIPRLREAYSNGLSPVEMVEEVLQRCAAYPDRAVWISRASREQLLARAQWLIEQPGGVENLPLYGIPFAVKDNIDCLGFATTAACPAYAYQPDSDAFVVAKLLAAGAILIGKTNLDQFATGLVGTRSPHGAPRCVFDADYVSGGSSSGSAVAVGAGLVSFALGTDTAGSGRVPAAFNNLVGVKPTKGLVSTSGVVPACRSLDCVTVFAASCGEADLVRGIMQGEDDSDPYSRAMHERSLPLERFRFGYLPQDQREFFGDDEAAALYAASISALQALGGEGVEIDYRPFQQSAELLYSGPWVAERAAAIGDFLAEHGADMDPTVRTIVEGATRISGVEAFKGEYRLRELAKICNRQWQQMDVMLLPTAPTIYRVEDVAANPIELNSRLGTYTNFVNLLDCSAVAVPAGFRASNGLPFGVTLIAPAFCDSDLARLADRLHRAESASLQVGGTEYPLADESKMKENLADELIQLAVVGAHLSGQPLNHQLTRRGARLQATTRTAGDYRLYALAGTKPAKPGLIRDPDFSGAGLEVEVWALTAEAFGEFTAEVPAPLGIGSLILADGSTVKGFICEPWAIAAAEEITHLGGWRNYLTAQQG
ncbi:allophanate hydrolase [Pelobacter seleniigenes]|uniref:allophanate hydrolase n=1 Tax=Pelobacter seleniigenes TaxID=407188 RepID=UPI0004A6FCF2|nr:allophanate hydrolase [Pelobacter seleniigenes]